MKFSDPLFNHGWWQELEAAGMDAGLTENFRFRGAGCFYPKGHQLLVVEISKHMFICCQQGSELLLSLFFLFTFFREGVCLK